MVIGRIGQEKQGPKVKCENGAALPMILAADPCQRGPNRTSHSSGTMENLDGPTPTNKTGGVGVLIAKKTVAHRYIVGPQYQA